MSATWLKKIKKIKKTFEKHLTKPAATAGFFRFTPTIAVGIRKINQG